MSSLKSKGIIAAAAGTIIFSGLSATAGPAISVQLDRAANAGPVLVQHPRDGERGFVFDLRDLFPDVDRRGDFRDRLISERRAARIATDHTPMRIRGIDREGRTFVVRGFNRRLGSVAVRVDGRTARVTGVERLDRDRPGRVRLIGALRAGELARERVRMRISQITRAGNIYNVHGFNRRDGRVLVRVDGRSGEIIAANASNGGTIGTSGISIENGTTFRTNRPTFDYRDVGR